MPTTELKPKHTNERGRGRCLSLYCMVNELEHLSSNEDDGAQVPLSLQVNIDRNDFTENYLKS